LSIFQKFVDKIKVSLKPDKNKGYFYMKTYKFLIIYHSVHWCDFDRASSL